MAQQLYTRHYGIWKGQAQAMSAATFNSDQVPSFISRPRQRGVSATVAKDFPCWNSSALSYLNIVTTSPSMSSRLDRRRDILTAAHPLLRCVHAWAKKADPPAAIASKQSNASPPPASQIVRRYWRFFTARTAPRPDRSQRSGWTCFF